LDALAPSLLALPGDFPIPWVGYVYDFQHRYYPALFTAAEIKRRDDAFATMLSRAHAVVVNSQSVAADIDHSFPQANAKVFPLPFNAAPQPAWLEVSPESAQQKYGTGRPYFIICNQFWKHKDHATAFDAFDQFARAEPNVDLVCTGTPHDYRFPEYVASLRAKVAESGLADRVHILGSIPKLDQIALLKGSIALIQPTLFEGGPGGGAVFDAVSLGVPSIVSNISTNLEISDSSVTFFPAGSVQALSTAMGKARARAAAVERPSNTDLQNYGTARQRLSGAVALQAISFVRSQAKDATR
jgi:glycosyltransferase involved in cell wall biosynthesis